MFKKVLRAIWGTTCQGETKFFYDVEESICVQFVLHLCDSLYIYIMTGHLCLEPCDCPWSDHTLLAGIVMLIIYCSFCISGHHGTEIQF